jgi:hypothetical protein
MTLTTFVRTAAFGVSVALSSMALAQGAPPPSTPSPGAGPKAKVHHACRADRERLCKDVKPGDGRIRECLKAHQAQLSDTCKSAVNDPRHQHIQEATPR